ncbi:MAG: hypothetical protein KA144_00085 [Xanthomonadaceae bacterium]|nr:hypothetical protein [Xanthomonadaceae bacterium]
MSSILLGSALVAPAFAHDSLPAQWCMDPNTAPSVVAEFVFTPKALATYRAAHPILDNPPEDVQCTDERSCGIVDDWFWADQMAQAFCAAPQSAPEPEGQASRTSRALRTAQPAQPAQSVPFVHSPAEFNDREHHQRYGFDKGPLRGACVVCVPIGSPTTPSIPPTLPPDADR